MTETNPSVIKITKKCNKLRLVGFETVAASGASKHEPSRMPARDNLLALKAQSA